MSRIAKFAASILTGVLLAYVLLWCWAYIAANNPLPRLLIREGLSGDGVWLTLTVADFLMNILMCVPAAWALNSMGRALLPINTLLAVVAFTVTSSFLVGLPLQAIGLRVGIPYLLLLVSLPVAVWLLFWLRRNAPNNSFKPTPLRGAA